MINKKYLKEIKTWLNQFPPTADEFIINLWEGPSYRVNGDKITEVNEHE